MHDLLNRDISNVNLRDFPRTDALFDQIYNTMTTVQKYWFDVLNRASLSKWKEGKWDFISNNDQYVEFLEYATAAGDRYPGTAVQFSKALNRMCPGIITKRPREDKDRVRVRIFPEISICRKHFEGLIKMDIKWETML